eukprot:scaffold28078_cov20-Tisochrysis_lutea.AAC.2
MDKIPAALKVLDEEVGNMAKDGGSNEQVCLWAAAVMERVGVVEQDEPVGLQAEAMVFFAGQHVLVPCGLVELSRVCARPVSWRCARCACVQSPGRPEQDVCVPSLLAGQSVHAPTLLKMVYAHSFFPCACRPCKKPCAQPFQEGGS